MIKRVFLFLSLTIGIGISAYSQSDFRKGFIVTLANDTIVGLVDFREGSRAYTICVFKQSVDQNATSYAPEELIGYGFIDDKQFEARDIEIQNGENDRIFLEVIVRGLVSLFKYERKYFVEKVGEELFRLSNDLVETEIEGKIVVKKTNKYVGLLNVLMFDCFALRERIQRAKLEEKYLTRLVEDYNSCMGETALVYKAKKPWYKGLIGVTAGMNFSNIKFSGDYYEHLSGSFEVDNAFMGGISFGLLSPRINERISVQGNLLFLHSDYYSFNLLELVGETRRSYVTVQFDQLKIPLAARYSFPGKKVEPFINAGITSAIHFATDSKWTQEVESNGVVQTVESEALEFKKSQFGFWGGIGITVSIHPKLTGVIELRVEKTNGISHSLLYPSTISSFQVVLGIGIK